MTAKANRAAGLPNFLPMLGGVGYDPTDPQGEDKRPMAAHDYPGIRPADNSVTASGRKVTGTGGLSLRPAIRRRVMG